MRMSRPATPTQNKAAKQMYARALVGKEKVLGREPSSTQDTVNSPGNLYRDQGKMAGAEEMFKRTHVPTFNCKWEHFIETLRIL
jgi:hypothetical protein